MASSPIAQEQTFIGPGLSLRKRLMTLGGVFVLVGLVLTIALRQGTSALGSTIVAVIFILGFIIYLRIIEPVPFVITLAPEALVKRSRNGEEVVVRWEDLTRIKEEFFASGKRIAVIAYRQVSEPGQKPKAWAVYRDDVTDIDGLAEALKQTIPETCVWQSETVHD